MTEPTAPPDEARTSLRARSCAAVTARYPDLAPVLAQPPATRAIFEQGRIADIALGAERFYGGDGLAFARDQVEAYLRKPTRLHSTLPRFEDGGQDLVHQDLALVVESCRRSGVEPDALPVFPPASPGFLIVVGIGLGYHLPLLLESLPVRCLILADTHPEFLRHAVSAIDWQALLEGLEARGRSLRLILSADPDILNNAIGAAVEAEGTQFLDGAFLFLHHPAAPLAACFQRLETTAALAFATRGSFEDECLMIRNAAANLAAGSFSLIDGRQRPPRAEPAALIASGPSLGPALERILAIREGLMVFSCGTALRPCLLAGIVPDYHVELENIPDLYDSLREAGRIQDLSEIALIASVTVDPTVPKLFKTVHYFFRESTVSSQAFAEPADILVLAQPLVANTALRTAVALGFRDITLFGVDCGSREPDRTHVAGTVHEFLPGSMARDRANLMPLTVPANFGGEACSNLDFLWSKKMLERAIAVFRLKVVNCSDGVAIEGAVPCRAADLPVPAPLPAPLPGRGLDRRRVCGAISRQLPRIRGNALRREACERLACGFSRLVAALAARIEAAGPEPQDDLALWLALDRVLAEEQRGGNPSVPILLGSLDAFKKFTRHVSVRLPESGLRAELTALWLGHLRRQLAEMERQVRALVAPLGR